MSTNNQEQAVEMTTSQNDSTLPLEGGVRRGSATGSGSTIDDFLKQLRERVVHFTYRKKDGTLRDAYGTTCLENIPSECWPKGIETRKRPEYLINYWDIQRNAWRSFNMDNFYGWEEEA